MPIYEYKCANGHVFDVIQRITDEPLTECQDCDAPAERVLHPVAVHFKGSGFYTTDYGKKKAPSGNGSGEAGKESKASDGADAKPSESKSGDSGSKSDGSKPKAGAASD